MTTFDMISICGVDNVHNGDEADDGDDGGYDDGGGDDEDLGYDDDDGGGDDDDGEYDDEDDHILSHLGLGVQQLENSPYSTLQIFDIWEIIQKKILLHPTNSLEFEKYFLAFLCTLVMCINKSMGRKPIFQSGSPINITNTILPCPQPPAPYF